MKSNKGPVARAKVEIKAREQDALTPGAAATEEGAMSDEEYEQTIGADEAAKKREDIPF